jgi:hypothetical protein
MMQPSLFLRIAAALTLLLGIGHMMGRPWTPAQDPLTVAVTAAMKSHRMHVMGFQRTMMEFYVGFGLTIGINLLLQAVLLWLVADLASREPRRVRVIAAMFFIANAAVTVVAGMYLFTVPLVFSAIVTLFLGLAVFAPLKGASARG